jgi:hypothetical protein
MPQSLIGLKQIKSGEIGSYVTGFLGVGATGTNSVSIYKDLFVTGKANFSGDVSFANDVTFVQEALFYSGVKFSGDITGYKNLIVSGNSLVSGISTFKTGYFQNNLTVSGTFTSDGAAVFNDPTTFTDTSTFNSAVVVTSTFSVGTNKSTFSGDAALLGNNVFGVSAGGSTSNYFVGDNRFSGNSSFTGNIYSAGVNYFSGNNNFNSGVNFNSGAVIFSGSKQDFLTATNLSGYTKINRTGEAENLIVNQTLNLGASSLFNFSGSGIFSNNLYVSGSNNLSVLNGAYQSFSASSHNDFNSGSYEIFNNNSYLRIRTGAYVDLEGNLYAKSTSKTYYNSGSNVYYNSGSAGSGIFYLKSGSSIGIGTTIPSQAIDVQGYNINVNGTGYFNAVRISGYEPITEYTFNAKSYSLSSGDTYKTITYNTTSGTPIINPNVRATGTAAQIIDSDLYAAIISGVPTTTNATIMFSAPISTSDRYLLDVIIASPTF